MAVLNRRNLLEQWNQDQLVIGQLKERLLAEQEHLADVQVDLVNKDRQYQNSQHRVRELEENLAVLRGRLRREDELRANLRAQLQEAQNGQNVLGDQNEQLRHQHADLRHELRARDQLIGALNREILEMIRLRNRDIRIRDLVIEILWLKLQIAEEDTTKAAAICTTIGLQSIVSPAWGITSACTLLFLGAVNGNLDSTKQIDHRKRIQLLQEELEMVKRLR